MDINLLEKALVLSPNERVVLAERILESIDYETDENKSLWIDEVNCRMVAVNNGSSKLIDFETKYNSDQNT